MKYWADTNHINAVWIVKLSSIQKMWTPGQEANETEEILHPQGDPDLMKLLTTSPGLLDAFCLT